MGFFSKVTFDDCSTKELYMHDFLVVNFSNRIFIAN